MRFERKLHQTKTLLARTFRIAYPPGSEQIVRRVLSSTPALAASWHD